DFDLLLVIIVRFPPGEAQLDLFDLARVESLRPVEGTEAGADLSLVAVDGDLHSAEGIGKDGGDHRRADEDEGDEEHAHEEGHAEGHLVVEGGEPWGERTNKILVEA